MNLKGDIVRYDGRWYRVKSHRGTKVNLTSVFGSTIIHKGVPEEDVKPDHDNWYKYWSTTETYRSM